MKIEGVKHIGVAVKNLDECIERFEKILGLECRLRKRVEPGKVEVAVFDCGGTSIELVAPIGGDSPVAKFISRGGGSLHHICFQVDDIDAWLAFLNEQGADLVDERPREGAFGDRIAFVGPKSVCNFLIELAEEK
jgi:methylmalonyl-CoA/ethylmalonyl-CoA epimerase